MKKIICAVLIFATVFTGTAFAYDASYNSGRYSDPWEPVISLVVYSPLTLSGNITRVAVPDQPGVYDATSEIWKAAVAAEVRANMKYFFIGPLLQFGYEAETHSETTSETKSFTIYGKTGGRLPLGDGFILELYGAIGAMFASIDNSGYKLNPQLSWLVGFDCDFEIGSELLSFLLGIEVGGVHGKVDATGTELKQNNISFGLTAGISFNFDVF